MSAHKNIDRICCFIIAAMLIITAVFCSGNTLGIETAAHTAGYENRIFDRTKVHSLDIIIDDWDGFLETCESEEYSPCSVIIDGEAVKNVALRGKGNTSLSSVKNMNSSRYSFKLEFDHYENSKSYHGLDKLCLNNIIQDNTYMKDYLAYTLMYDFDVDAPLCSYVYITVNGEDWGLYLAVEAIEDSFLERNYGSNYGELYKPDSMSFGGGGPGNGKDFRMSEFIKDNSNEDNEDSENENPSFPDNSSGNSFPGDMPDFAGGEGFPGSFGDLGGEMPQFDKEDMPGFGGGQGGFGGFGGGMGSDDVKLKYTDDNEESYSNIFNNAKTDIGTADKNRLIRALKALSEQSDIENTVDVEEVIRYFVVHDFLCNGDSYTGMMIHNYYLYEKDGRLSMIPWDYNLAYGSFQGTDASSSVNSPIDTPVSGGMSDRPMISWIFDNAEYTEKYHSLFAEFIESCDFEQRVSETAALIEKYVEKDPTKFCTYEDFQKGVKAISEFCSLRAESVTGQLNGTIPSTSDGQKSDSSALIETGSLNIQDMGSMNNGGGFGGGPGGRTEGRGRRNTDNSPAEENKSENSARDTDENIPGNFDPSDMPEGFGGEKPEGFDGNKPDNSDPSDMPEGFGSEKPEGFDGNKPGNFDPSDMPEGFGGEKPEGFDGNRTGNFGPSDMPKGFGGEKPEGVDGNMPGNSDPSDMPEDSASDSADDPDEKNTNDSDADTSETQAALNEGAYETSAEKNSADHEETTEERSAPKDIGNSFKAPDDNRQPPDNFPGMGTNYSADNGSTYIILGICSVVLLFGIVFAVKFKR